jgi:RNA polymerase sigma factor (sigma-70 family)
VPELSDEKIMMQVRDGQLSELTELFERYHVPLYNFFLRLSVDKELSADLTQNLFYRVLRYRQSFEPATGTFRSWAYRMARNIYADHLRQQQRVPGGSGRTGEGGRTEEGLESLAAADVSYNEEQFDRLDAAMAKLSPEQREILVLSRYQGLKYDEISKLKDISVPAIKVQVFRALRQLREYYFKQ